MPAIEDPIPRGELVTRFFLSGAAIGLVLGLFEAALLDFVPWLPTLLESDVSYVIWLLAPLIDLFFYIVLGTALGCVACIGRTRPRGRILILGAALVGVAGAHVGWSLKLVHVWAGESVAARDLNTPLAWFALVFGVTLVLARAGWRRATLLVDADTRWPARRMVKAIVAATVLLLSGLGFHALRRMDLVISQHAKATTPSGPPNIILITLDTVRADHLSVYGYKRQTTPNLDRLAPQGVLFENAIAPSPWTLTTHASIFTGLLPHQHQASVYAPLSTAPRTLAEILSSHGYETVGFNANNAYGQAGWGLAQGFELYDDSRSMVRHNLAQMLLVRTIVRPLRRLLEQPGYNGSRRNAHEVNQDVIRWFRHRSNRPFFLFINYFDAHDPYFAPPSHEHRFGRILESAVRRVSFGEGFPLHPPLTPEEQSSLVDGYDNCLAYLDQQVGDLMRFLAESPQWPNTVVIITSDHGEAFGVHETYLHARSLYREVLHVPLIIFGPGIPAGLRLTSPARLRELFPTILDLALGAKLPLRRTSLRRFWTPGFDPGPSDDWVVSQVVPFLPEFRPIMISLMTSEWHYIHDSQGSFELYHWPTDPLEITDLSRSPQVRQTVSDLDQHLHDLARRSVRPWRGPEYLFALDRPGSSFLREIAFGGRDAANPSGRGVRVGAAQALFSPDESSLSRPLPPADAELLRSLPYQHR